MTTSTAPAAPPADERPAYRRALRPVDGRMVGGVAAGLAEHLGVGSLPVRIAFVVTTGLGGAGVLAYALLWGLLPQQPHPPEVRDDLAPGLAAAQRQGRRSSAGGGRASRADVGQAVALGVLGLGVVLFAAGVGSAGWLVAPALAGGLGVALIWWQADQAQRSGWSDRVPGLPVLGLVLGADVRGALVRLLAGATLVVGAGAVLVAQSAGWSLLDDVALALLLGLAGLALLVGPWAARLVRDLSAERNERVRAQERADMGAHLHDSVLQTLALLQRHAGDERRVSTLARKQERELRTWLFGDAADDPGDGTFAALLADAGVEIEEAETVPVEVVVVADTAADQHVRALVRAAREAVLNAARHSGADRVDVYAEVQPGRIEVYVRDRGVGFEPDEVPPERLGLRGSVHERMRRHGGEATVRSRPGEGTEVRLTLPLAAAPDRQPHDDEQGVGR